MTDTLPPGVHPRDPSQSFLESPTWGTESPVPHDAAGSKYSQGTKPYGTDNSEAFATFERASHDWTAGVIKVDSTINGGTAIVIGRQKGRKSVTIWVPTTLPDGTTPKGVVLGPDEDSVQQGLNAAIVLNPGDSITIRTEASIYAGLIGSDTTGACQFVAENNPPGGALGLT